MDNSNILTVATLQNSKMNGEKPKEKSILQMKLENGENLFDYLPDETLIKIFEYLPVLSLLNCDLVCKRFIRCSRDASLWKQLNLYDNTLNSGAMQFILKRRIKHIRLNRITVNDPIFNRNFLINRPYFQAKYVKILELRALSAQKKSIAKLLSHCQAIEELTLQMMKIDTNICTEIGRCVRLKRLQILDCPGITTWNMLINLEQLTHLFISSPFFTMESLTMLTVYAPSSILYLKLDGCRENMIDIHLKLFIDCCPQLREVSLVNCGALTPWAVRLLRESKTLNFISFRKCHAIGHSVTMEFVRDGNNITVHVSGILSQRTITLLKKTFSNFTINKDD